MVREVLPHLPGAKAFFLEDLKAKKPIIKTGAKYKFNSYFYRYEDLGRSEKLALQLVDCERNISSSIDSLWKGLKDETYCAVTKGIGGQARLCDSGILWIGRMPHNWSVDVLGSFVSQVKCKNVGLKEKNLLSLSHGSIKQKDINTSKGLLPESFDGYNIISRNDIVLRITDLQNDRKSIRVGQACESGIITSAYVTVRPNKKIDPGYLHYVILAFDLVKGFYGMGEGVRQSLTFDDIKKIKIPVPPIKEQRAIAASLNEKWAVIDFIAEKYREQLNNLESLKRAMVFDYAAGRKLSEEVPQ